MSDNIYLYLGLLFFLIAFLQYCCGVAIYFSFLSAIKSGDIVTKKENPDKFKTAITIQVVTGCFFVLLELFL